jgi:hypothetical protein
VTPDFRCAPEEFTMKTHFSRTGGNQWVDSFYRPAVPTTGNVLYADSVNGTATGGGFSPETATATLIQAQTAATASNADVVYIAPGHAESITGAAGMTFSKAGVRYEGLGVARNRPTITFSTSTAAQMIVSGANITFRNFVFDFTGIDAIVAAISVTGADVTFEDCDFIVQNATIGVVLGILTAATATRFRVERCRFLGVKTSSGTTVTACIKHEVGEDFLIKNCHFEAKMTQAILNATAIINGLIDTCTFHVYTGTKGVSVHASTQAWIKDCEFVVASGTAPIVGTIVNVSGNKYTTEGIGVVAGTAGTM